MYRLVPPSRWVPTPGGRSSWSNPDLKMIQELPGNLVKVGSAGDPLVGQPFTFRFQTHNGNNQPIGMYSDLAGTVPAVEFDLVKCLRNAMGDNAIIATQADDDKCAVLEFVNGVPMLYADGIDDCYTKTAAGVTAPASIFAVAKYTGGNAYKMLVGNGNPTGPHMYGRIPGTTWGGFYGTDVSSDASMAIFNVEASIVRAPNDVDFYTGNFMITKTNGLNYDASNGNFLFSEAGGGAAFFEGYCGAIMIGPTTLDTNLIRTTLVSLFSPVIGT